jgi:hypothetical protein
MKRLKGRERKPKTTAKQQQTIIAQLILSSVCSVCHEEDGGNCCWLNLKQSRNNNTRKKKIKKEHLLKGRGNDRLLVLLRIRIICFIIILSLCISLRNIQCFPFSPFSPRDNKEANKGNERKQIRFYCNAKNLLQTLFSRWFFLLLMRNWTFSSQTE